MLCVCMVVSRVLIGCRISSENRHKGGSRRAGSSATRSCITGFFWANTFKVTSAATAFFPSVWPHTALNSLEEQIDQQLLFVLLSSLSLFVSPRRYFTRPSYYWALNLMAARKGRRVRNSAAQP